MSDEAGGPGAVDDGAVNDPSPKPGEKQFVKRLWIIGTIVLVLTAALDLPLLLESGDGDHDHSHAHYTVDGWPGFFSIYGFLACVVLVVGSKALGVVLKRKDDYYDE